VLELGVAAPTAGRLMADFGAEVTKVRVRGGILIEPKRANEGVYNLQRG
jgi:crotonobetainyl-CoA:carnitine CoA-transferase CaiB-like acyl-CoA transferase